MIDIPIVWWFVIGQSASLLLLVILCFRLASKISTEKSKAQSRSTRYGQITEQFLPLVQSYPYDPKQFRFLGSPIDGVGFEEDKILLTEFKVADSQLTTRQRRIRDMVKDNKVEFVEVRISEKEN